MDSMTDHPAGRPALTARTFSYLHRRGVIRSVNSTSSSATNAPVTMRFEAWPQVPLRAVGFFADRHFAAMYPERAATYYRKSTECGPVTVLRRRVWMIRYVSSAGTLSDLFRGNL